MRTVAPAARASATAGMFEGYASLFGRADMSGDVVMRGAFAKSLSQRGAGGVRMLFQHDPNQVIGVWNAIYEDANGLFVRGRLLPEIQKSRELAALIWAGGLDGLSIGYKTRRALSKPNAQGRQLLDVDLWEISIVTFPMLPQARVSSVKSPHLIRGLGGPVIPPGCASAGGCELPSDSAGARLSRRLRRAALNLNTAKGPHTHYGQK